MASSSYSAVSQPDDLSAPPSRASSAAHRPRHHIVVTPPPGIALGPPSASSSEDSTGLGTGMPLMDGASGSSASEHTTHVLRAPAQPPAPRRWASGRPPSSPYGPTLAVAKGSALPEVPAAIDASSLCSTLPGGSYASASIKGKTMGTTGWEEHNLGRWNVDAVEDDDYLHDPEKDMPGRSTGALGLRALLNGGTMLILVGAVLALFMGYPLVFHYFLSPQEGHRGGFGLGGTNSTGQVPTFESMGMRSDLIDPDTDPALYKIKGTTGQDLVLVFSDEFNLDGRSFYPGDDPFWTAVDLWAHGTGDYEWYDPAAVTTSDGALHITASEDAIHNLNFRSGQLTTWNQFCFTGGFFEVSVRLPGSPQVSGWWPAAWTMGNLGRANYGATTEGMWPYSYDTCDTGTLINQTNPDGLGPISALQSGGETVFNDKYDTTSVSWLPGQRLSACTCSGDDHPGPTRSDGSYVGRSAPEIDVFEAQVSNERGDVSLSGQFAPFNAGYWLNNASGTEWQGYDPTFRINSYRGNVLQQSASGVADTNQDAYELSGGTFSTYGFEYVPGLESDGAYITWYLDGKLAWRMNAAAVGADARAQISARTIPEEPMYLILNLALSSGFGYVDFDKLTFPATMSVDYVRIYQPPDKINVGCDPPNFPTADYIQKHLEAYTNSNLTTWGNTRDVGGFEQDWPRNRLYSGGCDVEPRKYPGRERASATAA